MTVEGKVDGVVFSHTGSGNIASIPNGATFENVTFNFGNNNYHGFQHAGTINMIGCTLNGKLFSYADMIFTNCEFVQANDDTCTFTNGVTGKFLHVYNESSQGTKVVVKDCTFINNSGTASKAAVNIKETCRNNGNVLAFEVEITGTNTLEGPFPAASESASLVVGANGLWQVDDRLTNGAEPKVTVTLDETLVYPLYVASMTVGGTTSKYTSLQNAVNAARELGGTQTIQIISDITTAENVTIYEDEGFKLTIDGTKDVSSKYNVDVKITVDGKRVNGGGHGSTSNGASVTIQNVTFSESSDHDFIIGIGYVHHVTIKDCTFTGVNNKGWAYNYNDANYGITIEDCTFENIRMIQGSFDNAPEGFAFKAKNLTGTNVTVGFNVKTGGIATIENVKITTEKYAFRDMVDGYVGTFTLRNNTFTSTSTGSDEGAIVVRGGAVATAKVNVESGTYAGQVVVLNDKKEVLNITGGLFTVPPKYDFCGVVNDVHLYAIENTDSATSGDYPYTVGTGAIAMTNEVGYFTFAKAAEERTSNDDVITLLANADAAYELAYGKTLKVKKDGHELTVNAPEGYALKTTEAGGVTTYTVAEPVAQIGDALYASVEDAFAAAVDGNTIKMIANAEIETSIEFADKKVTFDLNGKDVTSDADDTIHVLAGGELVFMDSVGTGSMTTHNNTAINNEGTLTIENGVIKTMDGRGGPTIYNAGTLMVNDGTITADGNYINALNADGADSTTVINGGTISMKGNDGATVVATGGATVEIKGGTIIGEGNETAVLQIGFTDSGNFEVTGGTLWAKGEGQVAVVMVYGNGTAALSGDVKEFNDCTNSELFFRLAGNGALEVTGGFYQDDPTEYVDLSKYLVVETTMDGRNGYTLNDAVAVVKNIGYPSVAEAKVARDNTDDVITLLKNADYAFVAGDVLKIYKANDAIEFTYTVEEGQALTISEPDANGVVTYTAATAVAQIGEGEDAVLYASLTPSRLCPLTVPPPRSSCLLTPQKGHLRSMAVKRSFLISMIMSLISVSCTC